MTKEEREKVKKEEEEEPDVSEEEEASDSEGSTIDLRDDPYYQILSATFETDSGDNVAELLEKTNKELLQMNGHMKDIVKHLKILAVSVHQLVQASVQSSEE